MGAQTPDRLKQFQKRYHDWDDPQGRYAGTCKMANGSFGGEIFENCKTYP
jgi:hypothetical protein